jgi:hypothetical protein
MWLRKRSLALFDDLGLDRLAELGQASPKSVHPPRAEPRLDRLGVRAEAGPCPAKEPLPLGGQAKEERSPVFRVPESLRVAAPLEPLRACPWV